MMCNAHKATIPIRSSANSHAVMPKTVLGGIKIVKKWSF